MKTTRKLDVAISETCGLMLMLGLILWVALPNPSNGDLAVGVVQGEVFMSWRTNWTDTSSYRFIVNPNGSNVIHFDENNNTGIAVPSYINIIRDIGNVSLGIVSFRLLSLTVSDAGRYYYKPITGSDDAGGQVLVIAGVPVNVSVMGVADPFENIKYTMHCSAQSTSVPLGIGLTMHYQWKNETGQNITANDRYSFSTDQSTLIINPLKRQDAGTFVCEAWEHVGTVSQNGLFTLKVFYGPDTPHLSPSTTVYIKLEGESVPDTTCSADCFPGCTQVWMKGISLVQESSGGTLSLRQVYRDMAGDYTCWINNTEARATGYTSIRLVVQYPPVLTMKATNTSKGGRVVINCTASGVPDNYTFYKWTHMAPDVSRTIVRELEPTRVSSSEVSFTIDGATYQDTGFYACKASNGIVHYTTGQLIMEDMVSVWITDQPVIASDAYNFDAEKGKTGYMHIEFYSGLFQPLVTWYIIKNGTTELLQNSSDFGIYLSAVTVELKYYQKTIQLPGYNASLEVFDVNDEKFALYKVEINNSFAEPSYRTLELKPRGPPETPADLSVVPDSVTTHSLQLTWQAGFHGGAPQTFVIEYREAGRTIWLNKSEPRGLVQYVTLNSTITDLKDGTAYEFRIYSENIYNRSQISSTVNETTRTVPSTSDGLGFSLPVAGIAGGISAGIVCTFVIGIFIFLWRRYRHKTQSEHDNDVLREHEKRNSIKASSVKQDGDSGKEYEGLHFNETEASQYLQLNGITLEENRNVDISLRSPEGDSYEKLHPYVNSDTQMYSSLKIPKTSKDSKEFYENA